MKNLYSFFIFLVAPLAALLLMATPRGRVRLKERFGFWRKNAALLHPANDTASDEEWLWLHGASNGEISATKNVILAVFSELNSSLKRPCKLLVTVTSSSAIKLAETFADEVRLLPFDSSVFYQNALGKRNIRALIITETEIWPGLLFYLQGRKVPVYWVNARIMEKHTVWHRRFSSFFNDAFTAVRGVAAQTDDDAMRFKELFLDDNAAEKSCDLKVFGSTKYDQQDFSLEEAKKKISLQRQGCSIAVTNIRPGEEDIFFPVVKQFQDKVQFFIIPRHAETFSFFKEKLKEFGISSLSFNDFQLNPVFSAGVVFVDAFGFLDAIVAQSSAMISCASFMARYQGHNLLTGASFGVPLCTGPHNKSSDPILQELMNSNAVVVAEGTNDIASFVQQVYSNDPQVQQVGSNLKEYIEGHKGITQKVTYWLVPKLIKNAF